MNKGNTSTQYPLAAFFNRLLTSFRGVKTPTRSHASTSMTAMPDKILSAYAAWRDRFLLNRLRLGLWMAISFSLTILLLLPLALTDQPRERELIPHLPFLLVAIEISLLSCLILHKTRQGRRYPALLFLGFSWSVTIVEQVWATLHQIALPNISMWCMVFLIQATIMPVRWRLHLLSQLGVIIYCFGVNTALGLKLPDGKPFLTLGNSVSLVYLFWFCLICDLSIYMYERLQRSEFYAKHEIESAYQKLESAEAKYRSMFENAIEGIFQSTPDGRYITANPALAKIYGYDSPDEVISHLTDLEHQLYVDPNRRAEFIRLIRENGSVSEFESPVYRQDGSIVWISEKAYGVYDSQGNLLYYEGLIEDITERKKAETALQEQFHFLQVLIDTIPAPVFYKDMQGAYTGCNTAFEKALGLTKEEIMGKTVYDIAPQHLADKYYEADKILLRQGGFQTYEGAFIYADGSEHEVIFNKTTFLKADGTTGGLVGILLDISERKRTEAALRVFFHAVSHDLRNPVLGMLMVLRNLQNQTGENISISRSILERMIQSSDRQLNLINSLLEAHVSEVQGILVKGDPLQLSTLVEGAIADLEPMLAKNQVTLRNLFPADLPLVNADPMQLWRVFTNLIANAIKHNPPGLCITLKATAEGDKIHCVVQDNGVGLAPEQCDSAFDLYRRGVDARNSLSLGLGLYLCRQIITAHHGEIGVISSPGDGATFWFTLPIFQPTDS